MKNNRRYFIIIFLSLVYSCSPIAGIRISNVELPKGTPAYTPTSQPATQTPTSSPTPIPSPIPPTPKPTNSPTPDVVENPITELIFTGSIVPARCVQAKIDEVGNADYLYENIIDITQKAHITVGTLNAALSDYPPSTGCVQTFVLVGKPENADALAAAGFDVMSVATNHIKNCGLYDCGDRAFFDTLANLERVAIQPVGGGENLSEALLPVVIPANGIRFGFISLGEIEALAFASDSEPGIAVLTDDNLKSAIAGAREVSDVVIVLPHWGSDYSFTPNYRQLHFAEVAVEAGADLVIGNHAHVIQGMKEIDGVPIYYGLGSFVFDQDWSLETQQGIIVRILFEGTRITGEEVIPIHIDGDGQVHLPEMEEAAEILARFESISQQIP